MTVTGFDRNLPYTVRGREADAIHVEFDLGAEAAAYRDWIRRTFGKAAA